ncbi:hypothetical protein VTN77DRAFT_3140 [Rasamsonia byssochlamydoides]|uniref:uncharacterized protein n=1 Tax=Rasamsonia byssochlamydoides TaxID=89139 RepID=UPI003743990D
MSDFIHKVKDAVKHLTHSTHNGPHDSNVTNKLDPFVDSDRDNRYGSGTTSGTSTGASTGTYDGYGTGSTNAGSYNSNLTNEAGDLDDRRAAGGVTGSNYSTDSNYGSGTTTGAYNSGYGTGTTTTGTHSSNLANQADPRVDSDRDNYGTTGGVTAGDSHIYSTRSTNAGPYDFNVANKLDQRVDSDLDNRTRHQNFGGNAPASSSYANSGSERTQKTSGLHDSKIANKLGPRVDSDLDNSRTVGGYDTRY